MKTEKKLGIWMDHIHADLMEFSSEPKETLTIQSDFDASSNNGHDAQANHKKQQAMEQYFKKILNEMKDYNDVLLFGPAEAKNQYLHFVRQHHHFDKIGIEVESSDTLNEKQRHAFVRDHFRKFDIRK